MLTALFATCADGDVITKLHPFILASLLQHCRNLPPCAICDPRAPACACHINACADGPAHTVLLQLKGQRRTCEVKPAETTQPDGFCHGEKTDLKWALVMDGWS